MIFADFLVVIPFFDNKVLLLQPLFEKFGFFDKTFFSTRNPHDVFLSVFLRVYVFTSRTDNLVVMLVLLYTILDEGGRGSDGEAQLENYMTLVEESNGFGLTIQLMNEHEDMEIYDKVPY